VRTVFPFGFMGIQLPLGLKPVYPGTPMSFLYDSMLLFPPCRIPLCVMSPSVEPVGTWVRSKNMASRRCEIESHRMHGCGTVSQQRQCFLVGFRWPLLKENLIIGGFQYTCSDTGRTGNQESKICRLPPLERLRRSALSEYPELHYPGATR